MPNEYEAAVQRIADHVLGYARSFSGHLASAIEQPESKVLADVLTALHGARPVAVQLERDQRALYWRVRCRLFVGENGSLEADSDPDLAGDQPGATVVRGLPGVAEWAGELVRAFHGARGENAHWLTALEVDRKLKSLRPTLSRKKGKTTWRVAYSVDNAPWRALIDIEKQEAGQT